MKEDLEKEEYITTPELCEWLKVGKSTVHNWREKGLPYTGVKRAFRYKKSEVLKWLEEEKKK